MHCLNKGKVKPHLTENAFVDLFITVTCDDVITVTCDNVN